MMRPAVLLLTALALAGQPVFAQNRPVVSEIVAAELPGLRGFPGIIAADVETRLGFLAAGQIQTRPAQTGDTVTAGQVLATLDQITLSEDVLAAEAALRSAQARAALAQQTHARATELARRNVASTAQLEAVTAERDASAAAVTAAEADLARARDAEGNGLLRAPADGVVIATHAEPGAVVTAGLPVLTLATNAGREAVIDVPAEFRALLPDDARFVIRKRGMDGLGHDIWESTGTLRLVEPVADSSAATLRLRVALDPGNRMRIGSLVTVLPVIPADPVLTVPRAALLDGPALWRIGPGRALQRVPVSTGATLLDRVVITDGVQPGDEILLRGIHSVTEGQIMGERTAP